MLLDRFSSRKSLSVAQVEEPTEIGDCTQDEWVKFFLKNGQSHYFYQSPGLMVHVKSFLKEKNDRLLVISPGRGESSLKYAELVQELSSEGFDVVVIDHRGQGFSSRMTRNPLIGYIDRFENYTHDLIHIVENFKSEKHYRASVLLAHGMGTIIGLKAILENRNLFDGTILSSPIFKLRIKKVPEFMCLLFLQIVHLLGFGQKSLFYNGFGDIDCSFEDNRVTNCRRRFQTHRHFETAFPQTRLGSPSIKWLYEVMKNARKVFKRAKELRVPILLMQAGRDQFVCHKRQDHFARVVQNSRVIRLKESRHEIFQEVDFIRGRAIVQVRKFLEEIQGQEEGRSKTKSA